MYATHSFVDVSYHVCYCCCCCCFASSHLPSVWKTNHAHRTWIHTQPNKTVTQFIYSTIASAAFKMSYLLSHHDFEIISNSSSENFISHHRPLIKCVSRFDATATIFFLSFIPHCFEFDFKYIYENDGVYRHSPQTNSHKIGPWINFNKTESELERQFGTLNALVSCIEFRKNQC